VPPSEEHFPSNAPRKTDHVDSPMEVPSPDWSAGDLGKVPFSKKPQEELRKPKQDRPSEDEADDEAVSEVVRKPTRTAGDLSEGGEASGGITLEELLRRVQRIEDYLGIGSTGSPGTSIAQEISELKASVSRLAQNISSSVSRGSDPQIVPPTPPGPSKPLPGRRPQPC
jgi:hypothetical protein